MAAGFGEAHYKVLQTKHVKRLISDFFFPRYVEVVPWRLLKSNCKVSLFTSLGWLCMDYLYYIHAHVWLILPLIKGHRSSGCRHGNPYIMLNIHILESLWYTMKLHSIEDHMQGNDFSRVLLQNSIG